MLINFIVASNRQVGTATNAAAAAIKVSGLFFSLSKGCGSPYAIFIHEFIKIFPELQNSQAKM